MVRALGGPLLRCNTQDLGAAEVTEICRDEGELGTKLLDKLGNANGFLIWQEGSRESLPR